MSVIKLPAFGGEAPSISPRNLPAGAAQTNQNLLLSHAEFRPLSNDAAVASTASGTKTLYRMARVTGGAFNSNPATGWITSTADRSYVKGQIDDELTERTYLTFDDGSAKPRAIDVDGADRVLGVPRPTKLLPLLTPSGDFTMAEANQYLVTDFAIQAKEQIAVSQLGEAASRRSGNTIYAGPTDLHGALFYDSAVVLASGLPTLMAEAWLPLSAARVAALKIATREEVTLLGDGSYITRITCVPWTLRFDDASLITLLSAIVFPGTAGPLAGTPVLTTGQSTSIVEEINKLASVNQLVSVERTQLINNFEQYWNLLTNFVVVDDDDDAEIWELHRQLDRMRGEAYATTVAIENKMAAVLSGLLGGQFFTDVLHSLGGASGLGINTVERVIDDRFYIATFVTDWGEESEPSEVSDLFTLDQNDTISIPLPATTTGETFAARNITKWRVYRTNVGYNTTSFQFVDELPVATTSMPDTKKASELGEVCPTITWLQPPYRVDASSTAYPLPTSGANPYLRGLVGMPNGIMAAFFDNTVAFCEPYVPYAWPVEYQISTEFPIVGLGVFGQTLFVGTTGNPYFISGADSASMSAQKLDSNQACVSRKSIAVVEGGALFASPDGLCVASNNGVQVISAGLYTREDWQALSPGTMFAADHENIYYLFYNNGTKGCLAFDLVSKKLGRVELQADAVFVDRITDTMYVANGTSISAVFGAGTRRTGKWKSGVLNVPAPTGFAWLKVLGDQSAPVPVTVRWYGDGVLRYTATVTSITPVRLPAGKYTDHEVEIESMARVTSLVLTSSTAELQQA
jgi:hypothetical protein